MDSREEPECDQHTALRSEGAGGRASQGRPLGPLDPGRLPLRMGAAPAKAERREQSNRIRGRGYPQATRSFRHSSPAPPLSVGMAQQPGQQPWGQGPLSPRSGLRAWTPFPGDMTPFCSLGLGPREPWETQGPHKQTNRATSRKREFMCAGRTRQLGGALQNTTLAGHESTHLERDRPQQWTVFGRANSVWALPS